MQNAVDEDELKEAQAYSISRNKNDDSDEEDSNNPTVIKKKAAELSRALAVLAIKPSTFSMMQTQNKLEELRQLLDDSLKERTENWYARQRNGAILLNPPEEEDAKGKSPRRTPLKKGGGVKTAKDDYQPHIDHDADLPTMHEAYQFLKKTYVDDVIAKKQSLKHSKVNSAAVAALASVGKNQRMRKREVDPVKEVNDEAGGNKILESFGLADLAVSDPLSGSGTKAGSGAKHRSGKRNSDGEAGGKRRSNESLKFGGVATGVTSINRGKSIKGRKPKK